MRRPDRSYRRSAYLRPAIAGFLAVCAGVALAGPPFAEHAASGLSLVVPTEKASLGTVYHALSRRDRQVYFESDAPLEDIKGQSNQVIGFAIAGPADSPAALRAGEWHLPVRSMRTGIELRDEHLAGKDWLDAESHPNIVFQIERVRDIKPGKQTDAFSSYTVTLEGDMALHGTTRRVTIPSTTLVFMPESESTRSIAAGDLLAIRTKFEVILSEYGVSHPVIGSKVAETVTIDLALYSSTVAPEKQPKKEEGAS